MSTEQIRHISSARSQKVTMTMNDHLALGKNVFVRGKLNR